MTETALWEAILAIALIIGAGFMLVGSIGLLKLDTTMKRLHAPTKAATLGVGALLAASMLHAFVFGEGSLKEMLIMAFLFVTAPITANFIAKVAIHGRLDAEPPAPDEDENWSTLMTDENAGQKPDTPIES